MAWLCGSKPLETAGRRVGGSPSGGGPRAFYVHLQTQARGRAGMAVLAGSVWAGVSRWRSRGRGSGPGCLSPRAGGPGLRERWDGKPGCCVSPGRSRGAREWSLVSESEGRGSPRLQGRDVVAGEGRRARTHQVPSVRVPGQGLRFKGDMRWQAWLLCLRGGAEGEGVVQAA